jgi:phosphomannomutase
MAFGTFIGKKKRLALSMDIRESSPVLKESFLKGLKRTGAEVLYIGRVPTPLLYFAIAHYKLDGGAAVSASHNPPKWNGLKLCGPMGRTYGTGFGQEEIKEIYSKKRFIYRKGGRVRDISKKLMKDYENFLLKRTKIRKPIRIGIDPGNGADSLIAANILKKAGISAVAINDKPDGNFPSRSPEPKPENIIELSNLVKSKKLDFGVAFDGDGDRAMFVDDKGRAFFGDITLAMMVKNTINKGEGVVYELSSSKAVEDMIKLKKAKGIKAKTGRAFIIDKMLQNGAKLGGEHSTHFYFSDIYGFDDAIFAVIKMAELTSGSKKKMSELMDELPRYERIVSEFEVKESEKFRIISRMKQSLKKIKGAKIVTTEGVKMIAKDGWLMARASNTTPKVKIIAESADKRSLDRLYALGLSEFEKAKGA